MRLDVDDRSTIRFALIPAVVPAACYLLLETLPIAYAVSLYAFVGTPIVSGAALGWRHPDLRGGRLISLAVTYALASVLVWELADALVPLLALNLVNLPAYTILAATLFSVAALIARSLRSGQRAKSALS